MAETDDTFLDDLINDLPADEPAAEAPEDPPADPVPETPEEKTVPLAALHEARSQNRELRDQMSAQTQRLEALEGLRDEIKALRDHKEEAPTPDFMEDPKGYVDAETAKTKEELREQYEKVAAQTEESTEAAQQARFASALSGDEQSFLREHGDYYDALNYTREIRKAEFLDLGLSEDEAQEAINAEELTLASAALQRGKSPAEIAYSRATRWGYSAEQGDKPVGDETTDEERLERAEEAESMGGSGTPNLSSLMDAEGEDEFDQAWNDLGFGKMG